MVEVQTKTGLVPPQVLGSLPGVALFRAVMAGEMPHPPLTGGIPMAVTEADEGRVVWTVRAPDWFLNPMGGVHGGFAMTVLDSALGCAVHSALPAGKGYTSVEVKVNMTRPVPVGEDLRCEGKLITLGGRVGTSEARLTDARGRVLAFGTSTCLVFDVAAPG
ncbi:MAG: PaaI family thioesterase [Roseivivax sp.]|nr:PaaI family thioesterase [Roseivivax sp.]